MDGSMQPRERLTLAYALPLKACIVINAEGQPAAVGTSDTVLGGFRQVFGSADPVVGSGPGFFPDGMEARMDDPSGPSILLVEDNPADVRLAEEVLREVGLVRGLRVARTGEQALRMLRREDEYAAEPTPSLILLDLNLPGRSGREVLADIKQDPLLRRIPVVIVSTSSAPSDVIGCYDAHANCYVTKPMNLNDFFAFAEALRAFWFQWAKLPHSASMALGTE